MGHLEFRASTLHDADDPLRIWELPNAAQRYVIGADVAEGLDHGDYSCAQVLNVHTGGQDAMWHGHIPPDEFADVLAILGRYYGNALVGVEANNHGLTTVTALRNLRYKAIYRRRTVDRITNKASDQLGWLTTKTSKPLMIDELAMALKADELGIVDKGTIAELKTFVRNERGQMSGSPHDDRVMALAIANQMRKWTFVPEYRETTDDYMSMDWWMRQAKGAEPKVPVLGGHHTRH